MIKDKEIKEDNTLCPDCGGEIAVRNPTGKCDHLYYPEHKAPKPPKEECKCVEHNNGGEMVILVNDCPVHDELFGQNAILEPVEDAPKENSWEKRFDAGWNSTRGIKYIDPESIKDFIKSELTKQREEIVEELEESGLIYKDTDGGYFVGLRGDSEVTELVAQIKEKYLNE